MWETLLQVYGMGFGHATRCEPVINKFKENGNVNLHLRSFGKNREYLASLGYEVEEAVPDLIINGKDGSFSLLHSTLSSLKETLARGGITKSIRKERDFVRYKNADVVVSDGCPYLIVGAHYACRPSLLITNQTGYTKEFLGRASSSLKRPMLKRFSELFEIVESFADEILVPDLPEPYTLCKHTMSEKWWVQKRTRYIGPLVRSSIAKKADIKAGSSNGTDSSISADRPNVLVMVGGQAYRMPLLKAAKRAAETSKYYFNILSGSSNIGESGSNYRIWPMVKDNSSFLNDPMLAAAVIQSGHSGTMEMIKLGVPFVTVPDENQIEQMANATRSEELGIADKMNYKELGGRHSGQLLNERIERVAGDSYRRRIGQLSRIAGDCDAPAAVLERALYYAERYDAEEKSRIGTHKLNIII